MCEHICKICRGHEDGGCLKDLDINNVKGECKEWFPHECPITGMTFSGIVLEDDGTWTPTYSCSPYTSYSLPTYYEEEKAFYRKAYDDDEGHWSEECQHFADLEEVKENFSEEKFKEIKEFYNIKN